MIRVVLADDHSVVRRGIRDFLTEAGDITVVAEAATGSEAATLVAHHQPDVVILDIRMADGSGIETAQRLRDEGQTLGILILTAFDDPPYIRAAVEAGANGYMLKSASADEIVEAVRAVHEGKIVFNAGQAIVLSDRPATQPPDEVLIKLTEREQVVLDLAARGLTNKAIGFQLSISDRTVQGHLANIYERLSVSSRTEAVTKAVTLGLIKLPYS
ncbi:MAG: response regulator [Aggregatilineales bacterium]